MLPLSTLPLLPPYTLPLRTLPLCTPHADTRVRCKRLTQGTPRPHLTRNPSRAIPPSRAVPCAARHPPREPNNTVANPETFIRIRSREKPEFPSYERRTFFYHSHPPRAIPHAQYISHTIPHAPSSLTRHPHGLVLRAIPSHAPSNRAAATSSS